MNFREWNNFLSCCVSLLFLPKPHKCSFQIISLVTFQAQFNEALITLYSGYHPDHFWKEEADELLASSAEVSPPSSDASTASSPTEKKSERLSSTNAEASPAKMNNGRDGATANSASSNTLEEQMKLLMSKLEQQSIQMEKQAKEMEHLRSLAGAREQAEQQTGKF